MYNRFRPSGGRVMGVLPPSQYQAFLRDKLHLLFRGECDVRIEWSISGGDDLWHRLGHPYRRRAMYEPRIDVAVGPFAIHGQYGGDYDDLIQSHSSAFQRMLLAHDDNVVAHHSRFRAASAESALYGNHNARCLLAIEIERHNAASKYLMGSAVNAAALGRLGVIVCWDLARLHHVLGLREYLCFLSSVGKNTFSADNLLILSRDQMDTILCGDA
jgi:hypothetical protein